MLFYFKRVYRRGFAPCVSYFRAYQSPNTFTTVGSMILTLCLNPTIQKTLLFPPICRGNVNRALYTQTDASGKGVNVSRVLTQLGSPCLHVTALGGASSPWFCSALESEHIAFSAVESGSEIRTCTTVIESSRIQKSAPYGKNVPSFTVKRVTELTEEGSCVDSGCEKALRERFCDIVSGGALDVPSGERVTTVVISGSKARGFSDELFPDLVLEALTKNITVIADYRALDLRNTLRLAALLLKESPNRYTGTLIIKPNFDEFCQTFSSRDFSPDATFDFLETESAVKVTGGTRFSRRALIRSLKTIYANTRALSVITDGTKPLTAYDGKTVYRVPCSPLLCAERVQNTIGCGDAFTAGFAASFTRGESFETALREGCRCGARNAVTFKPGSVE